MPDRPTEALEKAVLTGRIRDALRTLGYAVPEGSGLGSPMVLASMVPAIRDFTVKLGPVFAQRMSMETDATRRAALFAAAAEDAVRRRNPGMPPGVMQTIGALAAGFVAYRSMKKRAGGRIEDVSLGDLMSTLMQHFGR